MTTGTAVAAAGRSAGDLQGCQLRTFPREVQDPSSSQAPGGSLEQTQNSRTGLPLINLRPPPAPATCSAPCRSPGLTCCRRQPSKATGTFGSILEARVCSEQAVPAQSIRGSVAVGTASRLCTELPPGTVVRTQGQQDPTPHTWPCS
jgi:hypothetical protein